MHSRTVHCLCLIHPIDPRGSKIGGIETHIRLLLQHAPDDWRVLVVGADGYGDCELGEVSNVDMNGRRIEFFPVIHYPDAAIHEAAKRLHQSITVQFAVGLLKSLTRIRRALGTSPASVELERFEFAMIPYLLGVPALQVIHGEGSRNDKMDSLIKKYWLAHRTAEEVAIRMASSIVCVNPSIEARIRHKLGNRSKPIEFMPVPVDTALFKTCAFDHRDGIFRVVFAGRLDEFKDPPTMFRTLSAVHDKLGGKFEFHYIGTSDPHRYAEFALVEGFTTLHGFRTPAAVAAIVAHCHAGILTSFFEGMPCYLLELLSVGRPVVAIRLPQYELVVEEGISGSLVDRQTDNLETVQRLSDRLLWTWSAIRRGELQARAIHDKIEPFSTDILLRRHFARHEWISKPKQFAPGSPRTRMSDQDASTPH
jgi:glycosyltransferase involved in cell wall biosynthesis